MTNAASERLHCVLVRDRQSAMAASMDLVLVEWQDSRRGEGWVRLDELESTITQCRSVGWIIAKDALSLTLAGHLGENPAQCCGDLTIPNRAIQQIIPLKVPTRGRVGSRVR